jgi:hypothetical protein
MLEAAKVRAASVDLSVRRLAISQNLALIENTILVAIHPLTNIWHTILIAVLEALTFVGNTVRIAIARHIEQHVAPVIVTVSVAVGESLHRVRDTILITIIRLANVEDAVRTGREQIVRAIGADDASSDVQVNIALEFAGVEHAVPVAVDKRFIGIIDAIVIAIEFVIARVVAPQSRATNIKKRLPRDITSVRNAVHIAVQAGWTAVAVRDVEGVEHAVEVAVDALLHSDRRLRLSWPWRRVGSVLTVVAGIPHAVAVKILLPRVGLGGTVVAYIAQAVAVTVVLVRIGDGKAIVASIGPAIAISIRQIRAVRVALRGVQDPVAI